MTPFIFTVIPKVQSHDHKWMHKLLAINYHYTAITCTYCYRFMNNCNDVCL